MAAAAALLVLGAACAAAEAAAAAAASREIEHTAQLGAYDVRIAARGPSAFRVRLLPKGRAPFQTPMVSPGLEDAKAERFQDNAGEGVRTSAGALALSPRGTIVLRGPGGDVVTESEPIQDTPHGKVIFSSKQAKLYGKGAAPPDGRSLTAESAVKPLVCNRATYTPYYYSTDGYGALGAVNETDWAHMPLSYESDAEKVTWTFGQTEAGFELYLIPAPTLEEGTRAYYELVGLPAMLPRYAYGFGASRWGWEGRRYVEDVLKRFRSEKFPIDYFIVDFEWFVKETDYDYSPQGKPYYNDFGYNGKLFDEPQKQLATYQKEYNVRFGGIRKPRIGNTATLEALRAKKWVLPHGEPGAAFPPNGHYADERCVDFANPDAREWYADQMEHYTDDGVDFWWNDEGETDYWTYHWWNIAERDAVRARAPTRRFFSLNRAFTPGMARMGAAVWTGDVDSTWEDLKSTPGMMLNFVLGGAPYVGCDIGGFLGNTDGVQLTRWMQIGVFMPIMRVHSVVDAIPHFPWNFGDDAAKAIREALELRYRLVPYHYSLAHRLHNTGKPWIKPLAMEFPGDAESADITTEWMDGSILVAPVVREDSEREIYLPPGTWYLLGAEPEIHFSLALQGGQRYGGSAALDQIPAFVRPGAVLPLAPLIQHTEQLPGGPLEVQVYAGADGSFDLVEDDGESTAYEAGEARVTAFSWDDGARTLTWKVSGAAEAAGDKAFTQVYATLFDQDASGIYRSEPVALGSGGSISFDQADVLVE